jgi:hypothetical protein
VASAIEGKSTGASLAPNSTSASFCAVQNCQHVLVQPVERVFSRDPDTESANAAGQTRDIVRHGREQRGWIARVGAGDRRQHGRAIGCGAS